MLFHSIWSLCTNVTTIESWEIDRHKNLLRRSKTHGGYLDGPGGVRVRIVRQEFPYDIGFWQNITQGMCGGPLTWLWPLARTYSMGDGLSFKVNGFEGKKTLYDSGISISELTLSIDASLIWPPPDPDRINRKSIASRSTTAFGHPEGQTTDQQFKDAFRKRQTYDFERRQKGNLSISRGLSLHDEAWKSSEGERLGDFGVDEHAEFYDEDDIPLAQLLARRHALGQWQS